jgi:hypothetical protein
MKENLLQNAWTLKSQIDLLKEEYEGLISQLEKLAVNEGFDDKDNKILENQEGIRFCLSTTFKTTNKAVQLFEAKGLQKFIKKSVSITDLKRVCGEDEILQEQYATKSYLRKLSKKEVI